MFSPSKAYLCCIEFLCEDFSRVNSVICTIGSMFGDVCAMLCIVGSKFGTPVSCMFEVSGSGSVVDRCLI